MKATLLRDPEGDLKVVNAARVSFGRRSDEMVEGDRKLLSFLAANGHWSPFAHTWLACTRTMDADSLIDWMEATPAGFDRVIRRYNQMTHAGSRYRVTEVGSLYGWLMNWDRAPVGVQQRITEQFPDSVRAFGSPSVHTRPNEAPFKIEPLESLPWELKRVTFHMVTPMFVARQLGKHQVGLVWNEISRRYVEHSLTFHVPSAWRKEAANVKQGSSDEPVNNPGLPMVYEDFLLSSEALFNNLRRAGVCMEQARMVLPQSMNVEWYWTGSLKHIQRIVDQRLGHGAQSETMEIARQISDQIKGSFPTT